MKQLPKRPNLEHLRRQAKSLLTAVRKGDPDSVARLAQALSATETPRRLIALHDAQLVVAREYGFPSWPKLVRHVEEVRAKEGISDEVLERFVKTALSDDLKAIERMLELYPSLSTAAPVTALLTGEADHVASWVSADESRVKATLPPMDWQPLEYVCYSRVARSAPNRAKGFEDTARILIESGADVNVSHTHPSYPDAPLAPLYGACDLSALPGLVRLLLEFGARPDDGESLFHSAQHARIEMLELLQAHGAGLSSKDAHWTNTPLFFLAGHRASDSGAADALAGMRWLLEHGADPNVPCGEGCTPLHATCRTGNAAMTAVLLKHGADPGLKRDDGITPYDLAMVTGDAVAAELIRSVGGGHDLNPTVAFLAACARGDDRMARDQIQNDPSLMGKLGERERGLLAKLAELGRVKGVRTMLDLGFDPSTPGEYGGTPLHYSCYCGWLEVVELLLSRGASLVARDKAYDATPLGWALEGMVWNPNPVGKYAKIVKALVDAGADTSEILKYADSGDKEREALDEVLELVAG